MRFRVSLLVLVSSVVVGCMQEPEFTPTPTKTPNASAALEIAVLTSTSSTSLPLGITTAPSETPIIPTPVPNTTGDTATPTIDPSFTPGTPTPTPPPPTADDGLPADHYILGRPIPNGWTDYGDRIYPYGSTAGGKYRPHTGMEFWNPVGTPVVAVADSTVEYAGTDWETQFGPQLSFYGNLIVLRINGADYQGQPVFAVYGHLSEIYVNSGDSVLAKMIIGAVGGTGVANGAPHLHFEVRMGDPHDYFHSTRNPDLWIRPYYGYGTLAGKIVGANGAMLRQVSLIIKGADMTRYASTYAGDENISDADWKENFTYGDLPEGWYSVSTNSGSHIYTQEIYVHKNRTAWVEFKFDK